MEEVHDQVVAHTNIVLGRIFSIFFLGAKVDGYL